MGNGLVTNKRTCSCSARS